MKTIALKSAVWFVNVSLLIKLIPIIIISLNAFFILKFDGTKIIGVETVNFTDYPNYYSAFWDDYLYIYIAVHLLGMYVLWLVRGILLQIRRNGPFDQIIISSLNKLFWWMVIYGICRIVLRNIADILNEDVSVLFSRHGLEIIFFISIVYGLIEIFKYGAEIHAEQKLTI